MKNKLNKIKINLMKQKRETTINKEEINSKLAVINQLLTAFKNKEIALKVETLNSEQEVETLKTVSKQLNQEKEGLEKANRDTTLIQIQIDLVNNFLPRVKTLEEVREEILAMTGKTKQEVIGYFRENKANYDMASTMKLINELVK